MKQVICGFSVVALMLVGSALNAQEIYSSDLGCGCGQQSIVEPAPCSCASAAPSSACGCSSTGRCGLLRGRGVRGRSGLLGGPIVTRLFRGGIISAIRD